MPGRTPPSIDALLAAAGLDASAGLQIEGAAGAARIDPARPALLLLDPDSPPLAESLRRYPPGAPALLLLQRDDQIERRETDIARLDADLAALTDPAKGDERAAAVVLWTVAPDEVRHDFAGLRAVIARLRDPDTGCPWDLEQDHRSLRPHLLEETYEVLAALDTGDPAALREELGDLLMQIVLHAQVAEDAGSFDMETVSEGIRTKLVRRHPHVFSDVEAETSEDVARNWERIKADERDDDASALSGVPLGLPALARAQSLVGRAARQGFAWPNDEAVLEKLDEELREFGEATDEAHAAEEFGDLLFVLADFARRHEIVAEDALREAGAKFERRFRALESGLRADGLAIRDVALEELLRRWEAVKAGE